jgi:hypothetical protein
VRPDKQFTAFHVSSKRKSEMYKPGGGPKGRNVVEKPMKTGVGARAVNVKWPAQVGVSRGNRVQVAETGGGGKVLTGVRADPYKPPSFNPVRQGNEIAASTVCGPGGSRTVYKTGAQHGLATRANNARGRSSDD